MMLVASSSVFPFTSGTGSPEANAPENASAAMAMTAMAAMSPTMRPTFFLPPFSSGMASEERYAVCPEWETGFTAPCGMTMVLSAEAARPSMGDMTRVCSFVKPPIMAAEPTLTGRPARKSFSARRMSFAVAKRSAGFFCMAFTMMLSRPGSMSGLKSLGRGASSFTCFIATLIASGPSKGSLPVAASNSTTPSE